MAIVLRQQKQYPRFNRKVVSISLMFACIVGLFAVTASIGFAQTVAHWRFEEGTAGLSPANQGGIPGLPTPITDSSGNGNHMGVFDSINAPTYIATGAPVPFGEGGNNLALDFDGIPDSAANPREIYARGYTGGGLGDLNDIDLSGGWTVEVSFLMDTIPDAIAGPDPQLPNEGGTFSIQSILTKQGMPVPGKSEAPIEFRVRNNGDGDNFKGTLNDVKHLEVRGLDGSGDDWSIDSRINEPLVPGQWYNAAVTYNGTTIDLYLDSGSGYKFQQGAQPKTSGWYPSTDDWVIGRGSASGNPARWMDGKVDEVRISSEVLTPQELLYNDPADFTDLVTYTIDETQSSLTWSGNVLGFSLAEQSSGSLTANLGGTITAHLNGDTLNFDDDLSHIDMLANSAAPLDPTLGTTFTVDPGGPDEDTLTFPAAGEENMGFTFNFVPGLNALALRDAFFGLPSGEIDFTDGSVAGIEVRTKSNRLDFITEQFKDISSDLNGGDATDNISAGTATRSIIPGVSEEIMIPIEFEIITYDDDSGGKEIDTLMVGQIVAIRTLGTPGDFNADGDVDGFDFLLWQRGFGTTYDSADFANWESNFGTAAYTAGAAIVPEPSSLVLLSMAMVLVPRRTRRKTFGA